MNAATVFRAHDLVKRFGGLQVTDGVTIELREREVHALIGPNGAGKSTLIHLLSGLLAPDAGRIELMGQDVTHMPAHRRSQLGLARCFQVTSIFHQSTVLQNLLLAVQSCSGTSFRFLRPRDSDSELVDRAETLARRVGLQRDLDRIAGTLPHGTQRRLDLALALAGDPAVLLLDEPMAGMGPEDSQQLVSMIEGLREVTSLLLIEHDMDAVFQLADRITVLVQGRVFATGRPEEIRANKQVQAIYLGTEQAA